MCKSDVPTIINPPQIVAIWAEPSIVKNPTSGMQAIVTNPPGDNTIPAVVAE